MKSVLKVIFVVCFFTIWAVAISVIHAYAISAIAVKSTKGITVSIILILLWWILTIFFDILDRRGSTKSKINKR